MDQLEPWNMFMFTAEADADADAGKPAEVKQEPLELPQDDDSYITPEAFNQPETTAVGAENADDNTIFNFGLEPQVQIRETRSASITPVQSGFYSASHKQNAHSQDEYINYEAAVVYICPACGAEFNAQDAWKRHMNSIHNFNTRRGLNFVQVDKLYHLCLECNKRIAMHAMENLLKHKFTHLPYRCTKCKVCLRQYKYRQDLMVHLRVTHREDLLEMTKSNASAVDRRSSVSSSHSVTPAVRLEIKDIKENAVDIFENTGDEVEVKNELIEPDEQDVDADASNSGIMLPAFLEDALSGSSSHGSVQRQSGNGNGNSNAYKEELCEKYIQYICPQCGTDYPTQAQWRVHIEGLHDFGTRKGLNFQELHNNLHPQCLECKKVLNVNSIRALQLHKFTHLPHKSWLRCKLCTQSFVGRKEIIKHLLKQHGVAAEAEVDDDSQEDNSRSAQRFGTEEDDDESSCNDSLGPLSKSEERDIYEPQIDYLCPQCGKEFIDKKLWRHHIVKKHHLTDLKVLNFKIISEGQVMCLECSKVITNAYGIQNAQQHRITHMPFKAFIRCRMCAKSYTDRKGLVKHLRSVHRIGQPQLHRKHRDDLLVPGPVRDYGMPPLQPKPKHQQPERSRRPKEIVRLANVTYEIQYLDDDDDTMDNTPVPELSFSGGLVQHTHQHRCADCGASFSTRQALQVHQQEEHEFLDFNNLKPLPEATGRRLLSSYGAAPAPAADNEQSRDSDELLLVPTGDEEVNYSGSSGSPSIERYFCYMCPACGKEFKLQNDWRRHINESHNFDKRHYLGFRQVDMYRFQCTECNDLVSGTKLKGLQDHKFRHLPYKLYIKCLLCSTCYNHKPNMISHLRMRHSIVDTRSQAQIDRDGDCGSSPRPVNTSHVAASTMVTKPPGLKTVEDCISFHNAVDHESITYFCPQCNENFDTHVFWRKHIVEEHNLNSRQGLNFRQIDEHHYFCLQCYKRVTVTHTKGAIGQLQSHKFRHLPYKSFKCLACNREFVRKQMFFKHLNRTTNRCEEATLGSNHYAEEENEESQQTTSQAKRKAPDEDDDEESAIGKPAAKQHKSQQQQREKNTGDELLITQQNSYSLVCPQCGEKFNTWRPWREHINIEHLLGRRETLNFKQVSPILHQCRECKEHVNGKKLRDLQIHKFKHLPFSAYLKCRFCTVSYHHVRNMTQHLLQKHASKLQKPEEDNDDDESKSSLAIPDEDSKDDGEEENENDVDAGGKEDEDDDDDGDEDEAAMNMEPEIEINSDSDDDEESSRQNGNKELSNEDDNEEEGEEEEEGEVEEVEEVEEILEPEEQFLLG